jgi:hypothetical protein
VDLLEELKQNSLYSAELEKLEELEAAEALKRQLEAAEALKRQLEAAEALKQQLQAGEALKEQLDSDEAVKHPSELAEALEKATQPAEALRKQLEAVKEQSEVVKDLSEAAQEQAEAVVHSIEMDSGKTLPESGDAVNAEPKVEHLLQCQLCSIVAVTRLQLLEHYSGQHFREELAQRFSDLGNMLRKNLINCFPFSEKLTGYGIDTCICQICSLK